MLFALDVVTIERTGEFFRLLYDVKGRFVCHKVSAEESAVSDFIGLIDLSRLFGAKNTLSKRNMWHSLNMTYNVLP